MLISLNPRPLRQFVFRSFNRSFRNLLLLSKQFLTGNNSDTFYLSTFTNISIFSFLSSFLCNFNFNFLVREKLTTYDKFCASKKWMWNFLCCFIKIHKNIPTGIQHQNDLFETGNEAEVLLRSALF